jgi:hypothetical protein
MMRAKWIFLLGLMFSLFPGKALAELFIYPRMGQSQEQQDRDKFECHSWAVRQTGFDPMRRAAASTPPPAQQARRGGLGRGATRGAAIGAIGGAIGGDAGRGAAIGAGTGAAVGTMRRRQQRREEQQAYTNWSRQEASQQQQGRDAYDRAMAACLDGRGYTVR